jgi:hypothetical protein
MRHCAPDSDAEEKQLNIAFEALARRLPRRPGDLHRRRLRLGRAAATNCCKSISLHNDVAGGEHPRSGGGGAAAVGRDGGVRTATCRSAVAGNRERLAERFRDSYNGPTWVVCAMLRRLAGLPVINDRHRPTTRWSRSCEALGGGPAMTPLFGPGWGNYAIRGIVEIEVPEAVSLLPRRRAGGLCLRCCSCCYCAPPGAAGALAPQSLPTRSAIGGCWKPAARRLEGGDAARCANSHRCCAPPRCRPPGAVPAAPVRATTGRGTARRPRTGTLHHRCRWHAAPPGLRTAARQRRRLKHPLVQSIDSCALRAHRGTVMLEFTHPWVVALLPLPLLLTLAAAPAPRKPGLAAGTLFPAPRVP